MKKVTSAREKTAITVLFLMRDPNRNVRASTTHAKTVLNVIPGEGILRRGSLS
jgi:hypothetical protein